MALEGVDVFVDEGGHEPVKVGVLRPSFTTGRTLGASSFEYDASYLTRADRYEISPELPLTTGRIYTAEDRNIFGAFADASPDEWGQKIIEANHAVRVKGDPTLPRRIGDFDFLLGVSDRSRMGALRFRRGEGSAWLSDDPRVANLHELGRILAVTRRYETHEATDEDVEFLAGVATSPGGARPKANVVMDDGHLALAKLPRSRDGDSDVEAWEAVAMTIAESAGLRTSPFTLHRLTADNAVLVARRFDRDAAGGRVGYMSAATALGGGTHDSGGRVTYEEFADTISELTEEPGRELREMFGRIALTVFVNNVDDHWRNHGFLRGVDAWRLSPLFDVNPVSRHGTINSRAINDEDDPRQRDIRNLLKIADAYGLTQQQAASTIRAVADEVAKWPAVATAMGIPKAQQRTMAAAFDETQLGYVAAMSSASGTTIIEMPDAHPASSAGGPTWVGPHLRRGKPVEGHTRQRRGH